MNSQTYVQMVSLHPLTFELETQNCSVKIPNVNNGGNIIESTFNFPVNAFAYTQGPS